MYLSLHIDTNLYIDGSDYSKEDYSLKANNSVFNDVYTKGAYRAANIDDYLKRHDRYADNEPNEKTLEMIYDEMNFVKGLSENIAIKKRFYIVFEYSKKNFTNQNVKFSDIKRILPMKRIRQAVIFHSASLVSLTTAYRPALRIYKQA